MRIVHAFDVVGDGAEFLGDVLDPSGGTKWKTASGSMKRRISHGQAMRSIFGRSRVTQTLGSAAETSTPGPSRATSGAARLGKGLDAAFQHGDIDAGS